MNGSCKRHFESAAVAPHKVKPKRPAPFSIRLSEEERARLEREAGHKPLGAHIRAKLLGEDQTPRKTVRQRPRIDYELLGRVLAALGNSELASCLCILAAAAESGSLDVTNEVTGKLHAACADVREIRLLLISALGLRGKRS